MPYSFEECPPGSCGGTALTQTEAEQQGRPVLHVRLSDPVPVPMIRAWGTEHDVRVLNVAGSWASEVAGIYESAYQIFERCRWAEF